MSNHPTPPTPPHQTPAPLSAAEVAALTAAAEAATPGPWVTADQRGSDPLSVEQPDEYGAFIAYADDSESEAAANAAYIAAANPATVLRLLASRAELQRRLEEQRAELAEQEVAKLLLVQELNEARKPAPLKAYDAFVAVANGLYQAIEDKDLAQVQAVWDNIYHALLAAHNSPPESLAALLVWGANRTALTPAPVPAGPAAAAEAARGGAGEGGVSGG